MQREAMQKQKEKLGGLQMKKKTAVAAVVMSTAVMLSGASALAEDAGRTVGINSWVAGAYALDILANNAQYAVEANGDETLVFNDEGNVEKLTSNVENMISANVDGALWMGMFENMFAVGPSLLENAGIPFALYDKVPSDQGMIDAIQNMNNFAGAVANNNYDAGASMAQIALDNGNKKVLIAGAEVGDPNTDARVAGFSEAFEAGGGTILSVTRVATGEANGEQQACDNMLAAFPEADCFYCTGENFTLQAMNVIAKTPLDHEVKVYGTDLNPTLLENLKDGTLAACSGANWVTALYSAVLLENAMDGHKLTDADGKAPFINNVKMVTVPADCSDLYQKFFIDENPYEEEEIQNLLYKYNPDVTLEDVTEMIDNYSLEDRLIAKYNAGKVTAEELEAVGIEVK